FDFSLIASSNQPHNLVQNLDNRTIGTQRRKDAVRSKLDMAEEMIHKASNSGMDASCVLFDSWFAFPSFIHEVYDIGCHVICKLKDLPTIRYIYKKKTYSLGALYCTCGKDEFKPLLHIPGRCASIVVATKQGLQVRIVFYREDKTSDWSAFLSTNLEKNPETRNCSAQFKSK
ncbi:MAG: hypothetical protein SVW57_09755, partial [Thermodesulfobacteriota bacterium]|nr:hypothetical protein [Thermodesulfobacteriota bacterium]